MNLNDAHRLAKRLMDEHGLTEQGWRFKWDRSVRRFGLCSFGPKTISLSLPLTEQNDESEVRDTILHEIAHALAPKGVHHGPEWKATAARIGARPERCYDSAQVVAPIAPYIAFCSNVECIQHYNSFKRYRRRDVICGICRSPIEYKANPNA